jgi:DNA-binding NarL/FixJ family response regulator
MVVVHDGDTAGQALAAARVRLQASGWHVVAGLQTRPSAAHSVLEGRVTCEDDAVAAVLAAVEGYGVLVHVDLEGAMLHRLEDDLRRLGTLQVERGHEAADADGPDPDGLAILALLAEGHSLGSAAAEIGISRRTADRRLAGARRALGVERTTEAIAVAARRGLLDARRPR